MFGGSRASSTIPHLTWNEVWGKYVGTLTVKGITAPTKPGRYADGDTLYRTVWPGAS